LGPIKVYHIVGYGKNCKTNHRDKRHGGTKYRETSSHFVTIAAAGPNVPVFLYLLLIAQPLQSLSPRWMTAGEPKDWLIRLEMDSPNEKEQQQQKSSMTDHSRLLVELEMISSD
jgi:hypothetical protein